MKVTIRPDADALRVTYEEAPHDDKAAPETHRPGWRGWFGRKLHHYQTLWHESRSGPARLAHRVWDWLHKRLDPDEPFLARLHSASAIDVSHPPSMTADEARAAWFRYLAGRWRSHWLWFAFNALITPFTVLLIPVPGPNLVGFWFLYRSIHHGLVLLGLRRVHAGRIATTFAPDG